jgi:hypothetical protein
LAPRGDGGWVVQLWAAGRAEAEAISDRVLSLPWMTTPQVSLHIQIDQ